MVLKSFKSIQLLVEKHYGSFTWIQCVSIVSNALKLLVDQHYKALSHEFNAFQKFQIYSNHLQTSTIRYFPIKSRCFESYELVFAHEFNVFGNLRIYSNHFSKLWNLFEWLVEWVNPDCKLVSHEVNVFQTFQSARITFRLSTPGLYSSFTCVLCVLKLSNLFKQLVQSINQDYKKFNSH